MTGVSTGESVFVCVIGPKFDSTSQLSWGAEPVRG